MADLQRALEIAISAHKGQLQKNDLPYVLHPLTLMQSVASIEAKIVALLHDVVEDTEWTHADLQQEGFAEDILHAIDLLTHREGVAYDAYIEQIRANPLAREVKLADLKDNMNIRRIPTVKESDLQRIERYHRAWRTLGGDL